MDGTVARPVPHLRRGAGRQVTGTAHKSGAGAGVGHEPALPAPALPDPVLLAAQRRQARRTALVLGVVAVCVYVGFILGTGFRN